MKITRSQIVLSICLLLLHGCATTAGYEKRLKTWIGHDINELISSWGAPSSSFEMPNGNKMYTWLNQGGVVIYNTYNPYTNTTMGFAGQSWCKTTFTINGNNKIINWRWEGNACRAEE